MKRILILSAALAACGSEPTSGPERGPETLLPTSDAGDRDLGIPALGEQADVEPEVAPADVGGADVEPTEDTGADASVDVPVADTLADVPAEDVDSGVDVPTADAAPDVAEDTGVDVAEDTVPDVEPDTPLCDYDNGGFIDVGCGRTDCDDMTGPVHPDRVESCNFLDDNCDGTINEELDCRVYAHTSTQLYLVDPFLGAEEFVTTVPSLFDFDTDSDGNLFGISSSRFLHRFDETTDSWDRVGDFAGTSGNGFAIDSEGVGYITAGNNLYTLNLETAESTLVGAMGGGFSSSGDCVVDKSDQLFMTSSGGSVDSLITISRTTGEGRLIGATGYSGIWGLTAAWGYLFGFTSSGQVLEIDPGTGAATAVHTFSGLGWYGAASSPGR